MLCTAQQRCVQGVVTSISWMDARYDERGQVGRVGRISAKRPISAFKLIDAAWVFRAPTHSKHQHLPMTLVTHDSRFISA